jgi:hypothetical protein
VHLDNTQASTEQEQVYSVGKQGVIVEVGDPIESIATTLESTRQNSEELVVAERNEGGMEVDNTDSIAPEPIHNTRNKRAAKPKGRDEAPGTPCDCGDPCEGVLKCCRGEGTMTE